MPKPICKICKKQFEISIKEYQKLRKTECPKCKADKARESKKKWAEKKRKNNKSQKKMLQLQKAILKGDYTDMVNILKEHFLDQVIVDYINEYSETIRRTEKKPSRYIYQPIEEAKNKRMWSKEEIEELIKENKANI